MLEALVNRLAGDTGVVGTVCATLVLLVYLVLRYLPQTRRMRPLPRERPSSRYRRALVVDDDDATARAMARVLRGALPLDVEQVSNARDALARVKAEPFDVLVVDLGLPGMGGEELIRQVREEGSMRPLVPIVIVSGQTPEAIERIARSCGANAWVAKPLLEIDDLARAVGRLLGLTAEL